MGRNHHGFSNSFSVHSDDNVSISLQFQRPGSSFLEDRLLEGQEPALLSLDTPRAQDWLPGDTRQARSPSALPAARTLRFRGLLLTPEVKIIKKVVLYTQDMSL